MTTEGAISGNVADVAAAAADVLSDPRGWNLGFTLAFRQVPHGGEIEIVLAEPAVVDGAAAVCDAAFSCQVDERVYLNDLRWRTAVPHWTLGLGEYRRYVLNHELGHWFGLPHAPCPAAGAAAPVMQQQSVSLRGCVGSSWPSEQERERLGRLLRVPVRPLLPLPVLDVPPTEPVLDGPPAEPVLDVPPAAPALDVPPAAPALDVPRTDERATAGLPQPQLVREARQPGVP